MNIVVNDRTIELDRPLSVAQMLEQLKIGSAVAVEVDGQLIPGEQHEHFLIPESARVEVVSLAGGG